MQDCASQRAPWGLAVSQRRRELGLRQDELATLAGVSTRSVHAVESSKASIRLDVLVAVAGALGYDLSVGLGDERTQVAP